MVGVIVVNYNSREEILRLIESLRRQTVTDYSLMIVDNFSPDGSGEQLKRDLSEEVVILAPENRGFAAGVNLAIKALRTRPTPPDYYWILNPDMELDKFALAALLNRAKLQDSVVGSKVLYPLNSDNLSKVWAAGGFVNFDSLETTMRGNGLIDSGQFEESIQCDYVPGCSLFFSNSIVQKVGLLPEDYFLYFEETDWCLRATKLGYPIVYEPKSVVTHFFREEKLSEPLVTYYYNRNRRVFFFRYLGLVGKFKLMFRAIFRELPQAKKSLTESPDERYRALFTSHIDSCLDFIFFRLGKRKEG